MAVPNQRTPITEELTYTTPDGIVHTMNTGTDIVSWQFQGMGLSPHNLSTSRGPYQQGSSPLSVSLQERQITLILRNNGCSRDEYWNIRNYWIDVFKENRTEINNPSPGVLTLTRYNFTTGQVIKRAIDVFYEEGFGFTPAASGIWDQHSIQEAVTFVALNPLWYDPAQVVVEITDFTEQLQIPMTFPFLLGASSSTQNITYVGAWETYPNIELVGPFTGATIVNNSTGDTIRLAYIANGNETVTFNLEYRYKTVTSNCVGDLSNYLREGNISSFSLVADPLVIGGVNSISVYLGSYSAGNTAVYFKYYNQYRGI